MTVLTARSFSRVYQILHYNYNYNNILDLVLSSEEDLVDDLRIGSPIGGSDHASIEFALNLNWQGKEEQNIGLDYRKADYVSIVREMVEIDWNERFRWKEVNEMWLEFRSTVDELKEKHAAQVYRKWKKGSRNGWIMVHVRQ